MAGVDQHSDWRRDPVGRLAATSAYLATISFGERAAAERAAARVRRIHEHVTGDDPVTGRPYEAGDPALLLWVHAALVDSGIVAAGAVRHAALAPRTPTGTWPRWWSRPSSSACPRDLVPASVAALDRYLASVRPELRCTPAAAGVDGLPARPARPGRGHRRDLAGHPGRRGRLAAGLGPGDVRLRRAAAADRGRREEIRQALGVLDAVYLGEPGVLEARQRIALRMRAAQRA